MRFTFKEMQSIENTFNKVQGSTMALLPNESTDAANMRYLAYIVQNLRHCAKLLKEGKEGEQDAMNRLESLLTVE